MKVVEEEKRNNAKKLSKTIKLQYRDLTYRKQNPQILINGKEPEKAKGDPMLVSFVKENRPDLIKEEVAWKEFKDTLKQVEIDGKLMYVDENGEPITFIELVPREDKFDWKVKN
jgi:hypothetical protein